MLACRFLAEADTAAYCRVTAALASGWRCIEAVVKEIDATFDPAMKLGDL